VPPGLAVRYQPLVVGASWTFSASNSLETATETVTADALEAFDPLFPSVLGYRVVTHRGYGATLTAWWEDRGDQIVRHRELALDGHGEAYGDETFRPGRSVIDESAKHTALGAQWKHQFSDVIIDGGGMFSDCKSDTFQVQAVDEMVTVPAGTFQALKVERTDTGTVTWFARGVGKIKHVGATTRAELVSFSLPPQ